MKDLTDEEYARLAEKWTKTTPNAGPNGSDYFSQRKAAVHTVTIDDFSANYLKSPLPLTHFTQI